MDLHAEEHADFGQEQLEGLDAHMVDLSRAELAHELLDAEALEVVEEELPEFEDVVPRELVPLLHENRLGTEQLGLDGRSETDRATSHHQDTAALRISAAVGFLLGLVRKNKKKSKQRFDPHLYVCILFLSRSSQLLLYPRYKNTSEALQRRMRASDRPKNAFFSL